ncbi:MAG: histidinol dehydrogenase [bacterium]|nr:histidinol dehydrogenase [bacterium]
MAESENRAGMVQIHELNSEQGTRAAQAVLGRFQDGAAGCASTVAEILARVQAEGDAALLDYCRRFDAPDMELSGLRVSPAEFAEAEAQADAGLRASLAFAADRIRSFHERELPDSWMLTREEGMITGRLVRPVDAAGLYVPGGKEGSTPLVSSVLMNGIPAAIAGVKRRVMVTPPNRQGKVHSALLLAAQIIGIDEVYKLGSAWAIAALAFGTKTVAPVEVIAGPGNQYVAEAKRQVMGRVRIDMLAGPSEVLIVADESAKPAFIAADMLAQAEHDPQALALAIVLSRSRAEAVERELALQLPRLKRADIARTSLQERGQIFIAPDMNAAIALANDIAIEHLELHLAEPWRWLPAIRHAGAVFLGHYSPEAAGDYVAGPNHVLPTMGTAKIASALGVETFLKHISLIHYAPEALRGDAGHIRLLAELEGLDAHAASVTQRLNES